MNLKAVLYDGSYHPVDSSEIAFKTAANLAYKAAMPEASPVLLEPVCELKVTVPDQYMGDILGDLNKRRGRVMGMTPTGNGEQVIEAECPEAELMSYAIDLRSMTQSRVRDALRALRAVLRRRTGEGCRGCEGHAGSGIIASGQQKIRKKGLLEREVLFLCAKRGGGMSSSVSRCTVSPRAWRAEYKLSLQGRKNHHSFSSDALYVRLRNHELSSTDTNSAIGNASHTSSSRPVSDSRYAVGSSTTIWRQTELMSE